MTTHDLDKAYFDQRLSLETSAPRFLFPIFGRVLTFICIYFIPPETFVTMYLVKTVI